VNEEPALIELRPEMSDKELQEICDAINQGLIAYHLRHGRALPVWAQVEPKFKSF
jgi:hypothetical protein